MKENHKMAQLKFGFALKNASVFLLHLCPIENDLFVAAQYRLLTISEVKSKMSALHQLAF